ncbi:MAG: ATP-dependent DNA helicase [Candidatus Woesearchaeota archaeon]|nr:MAG: ATP-dependent DNA helicase [Candidatus Woesearchaeota archaeon]
MRDILFPHKEVRPIQDQLIQKVKYAIENKKHLIVHAPTGLGKTAATLPIAASYASKNGLTVFFLTPKHTQHKIAIDTLKKIKEKYNIDVKTVDLIGKKHMCLQAGVNLLSTSEFHEYCNQLVEKEECQFYNNTKEKVRKELLVDKLKRLNPLNVEETIKHSEDFKLCPFEVACVMGRSAEVIVADYYHLISPGVRNALFNKINKELKKSIIIIDESHNLPNKTRDVLTHTLSTFVIDNAIKELNIFGYTEYVEPILKIKNILETLARLIPIDELEVFIEKNNFISQIENYNKLIEDLSLIAENIKEEKKRSFVGSIANFMLAWTGPENGFCRIMKRGFNKKGKPFFSLTYRCLDPSIIMKDLINEAHSIICMSGTLTPTAMYKDLLGFEDVELAYYKNPFPKENRLSLIIPQTSTKFTLRNEKMFKEIAEKTADLVNTIKGNVFVFFPSYQLRDIISNYFAPLCNKTIFSERPNLSKKDKEDLIENFKKYKNVGAVLLGVAAGSLSEGVDLPGDFLNGVIVVGLPLAKPDLETKALINFYDDRFGKGWDYGYIYPAVLKSLQAAGRLIRSEEDKGVIAFLDERYILDNYFKCFPPDYDVKITKTPVESIKEFYS